MPRAAPHDQATANGFRELLIRRLGYELPTEFSGFIIRQARGLLTPDMDLEALQAELEMSSTQSPLWKRFISRMTIGESYFFRNPSHMEFLREVQLPRLLKEAERRPVRLWSAGCSRGEEPYTLAILVHELADSLSAIDVQIVATDIDTEAIEFAKRGEYGEWAFRQTPFHIQKKYFEPRPNRKLQLHPSVMSLVTFGFHHVATDRAHHLIPQDHFDLVLCRNVLMYLREDFRARAGRVLSSRLNNTGLLLPGQVERIDGADATVSRVFFQGSAVYYRTKYPEAVEVFAPQTKKVPTPEADERGDSVLSGARLQGESDDWGARDDGGWDDDSASSRIASRRRTTRKTKQASVPIFGQSVGRSALDAGALPSRSQLSRRPLGSMPRAEDLAADENKASNLTTEGGNAPEPRRDATKGRLEAHGVDTSDGASHDDTAEGATETPSESTLTRALDTRVLARAMAADVVDPRIGVAQSAIADEDFETAVAVCADLITDEPLNPDLHTLMAIAFMENGEIERAMRALRRAVYCDPDCLGAYYTWWLIGIRFHSPTWGRTKWASRHLRRLVEDLPDDHELPTVGRVTAGDIRYLLEQKWDVFAD